MNDILIYGAGGFGREIACMLCAINEIKPQWKLLGFIDDRLEKGFQNRYGKVLGNINNLNEWSEKVALAISIASPNILKNLTQKISNQNIWFPNLIAPDVKIFDKRAFSTGFGNIIFWGTRLSCDVSIGNFNILNSNTSLGHDVSIGSFNVFGPNTRISGNCIVGNENFFGVYSMVIQGMKIGEKTRIGANSLIIRNTKNNSLYFGSPAKRIYQ